VVSALVEPVVSGVADVFPCGEALLEKMLSPCAVACRIGVIDVADAAAATVSDGMARLVVFMVLC
jgi:hypothetical protein